MSDEPVDDRDREGPPEPQEGSDEPQPALADADAASPPLETDGEGVVGDHPSPEPTYPDSDDDIGGVSTPPDDEEMPLADHIEEMISRLAVVLLVGSLFVASRRVQL